MMNFNAIEILAIILIAIAVIKLVIFLINPMLWIDFIEKMYSAPQLISYIGLAASLVVLYFLINSGLSIIEILAVSLFIMLLMLTGLANYAEDVIAWIREQDIMAMIKNLWIYTIAWVLLIVWGIRELLFK